MIRRWTTPLLVFCALAALSANGSRARITLEDLLSVEQIGGPALSPDGRQFALVQGGQILLMPSDGGWPATLTTNAGGKSGVAWSPDGATIAFASQGSIWTVPARGGEPHRLTQAPAGGGDPRQATDRAPRWSPKGMWIFFETGRRSNNDIMVVSDDGLRTNFIITTDADEGNAAWSPEGTR